MPDEIEMKFPVASLAPIRRALRKAGAAHLGTFLQTDRYFDTPDRALLKGDRGLRIRRLRVRGGGRGIDRRAQLTCKGPVRKGRKAKVRREVQVRLDDETALEKVLAACGVLPMLTIQKRRASYRLGRCQVELDELPLIGCFVEVEGPGEKQILDACRKLGLKGVPPRAHYVRLLLAACPRAGEKCLEITFAACGRCERPSGRRGGLK